MAPNAKQNQQNQQQSTSSSTSPPPTSSPKTSNSCNSLIIGSPAVSEVGETSDNSAGNSDESDSSNSSPSNKIIISKQFNSNNNNNIDSSSITNFNSKDAILHAHKIQTSTFHQKPQNKPTPNSTFQIQVPCFADSFSSDESDSHDIDKNSLITANFANSGKIMCTSTFPPSSKISIPPHKPTNRKSTRVFISLCLFAAAECFGHSIISPFFPAMAKQHYPNDEQLALSYVFSVESVSQVLFSLFFGTYLSRTTPKMLAVGGLLSQGIGVCLIGFVEFCLRKSYFTGLSLIGGWLMGMGNAAFMISNFVYICTVFPDSMNSTTGIIEVFSGFGIIAGPLVASIMKKFEVEYWIVFSVGGAFSIIAGLLCWVLLPSETDDTLPSTESAKNQNPENRKIKITPDFRKSFQLLKTPTVLVVAIILFLSGASFDVMETLFAVYLERDWDLSVFQIGMFSAIFGITYAIAAGVVGTFVDSGKPEYRRNRAQKTMIYMMLMIAVCVLMTGYGLKPLHNFITTSESGEIINWKNYLKLGLLNLPFSLLTCATCACTNPTFYEMASAAEKEGLDINNSSQGGKMTTYGYVSGLWNMVYASSLLFGANFGGWVHELFEDDYNKTSLAYAVFILIATACISVFYGSSYNQEVLLNERRIYKSVSKNDSNVTVETILLDDDDDAAAGVIIEKNTQY